MDKSTKRTNRGARQSRSNVESSRQKDFFARARMRRGESSDASSIGPQPGAFVPAFIPQENQERDLTPQEAPVRGIKRPLRDNDLSDFYDSREASGSDLYGTPWDAPDEDSRLPDETGQNALEIKRRQLLKRSDWTGIEIQKPLIINYQRHPKEPTMALVKSTRFAYPRSSIPMPPRSLPCASSEH